MHIIFYTINNKLNNDQSQYHKNISNIYFSYL